jgi:hypothetical protein
MKQILLFFVLLTLVLGGCGRVSPVSGMTVAGPVLPDGEISEYVILSAGHQVGVFSMTVQHVAFRGVPSYRLDLVAKTRDGTVETSDSSLVFVARDGMVPLTSFRFIKTGGAIMTTAANYGDSAVAVSVYAPDGEQQQLLPIGPRTYDADQLTVLGRVIQIQGRQPIDIRIVNPMGPPPGGAVLPGRLSFVGDEAARVPAGNFDCARLVLEFGSQKVTVWYEKTGAHRMVRYLTENGELEMQLVAGRP